MAVHFKGVKSEIMAYWKDFNPLDIDNSYTEYVISEMKYVDSDILLLEFDYITTRRLRFAFDHFVMPMAKSLRTCLVKPVQNKMMAYLQDFYPLDIDDSYTEYIISELKYDHNDFFFAGCGFKQRNFECLPSTVLCHL